jgi:hypothetical protein
MRLASPITNKTSKRGNAVRATTSYPVTVDAQTAIPAGTYVEGVIDKVDMRGASGPSLQMHFTRILFKNGYTVTVDATNSEALIVSPSGSLPGDLAFASESLPGHTPYPGESAPGYSYAHALAAQQGGTGLPPLPPLHNPGPSIGVVTGITVGAAVAAIVALILLNRHGGAETSGIIFDTGWQFQMVLQSPLTLDATSVAGAVASSSAQ